MRTNNLVSNLALAMALSVTVPSLANAGVLNATYLNDAFVLQANRTGSTTTAPTTGVSASGANTQASTNNNYAIPSISATASSGTGWSASADSRLTYFIEFAGAFGFQPVTVKAQGGADFAGAFGSVQSFLFITPFKRDPDSPFNFDSSILPEVISETLGAVATTSPIHQTFSIDGTYQFFANEIYQVALTVSLGTTDDGSASGFIDPFFVAPQGFTLLISPDIGNSLPPAAGATPLPAALPLFASGLGVLGWAARRRKRKQLAA